MIAMHKKIIDKTNCRFKISFISLSKDDPKVRRPDISLEKERFIR